MNKFLLNKILQSHFVLLDGTCVCVCSIFILFNHSSFWKSISATLFLFLFYVRFCLYWNWLWNTDCGGMRIRWVEKEEQHEELRRRKKQIKQWIRKNGWKFVRYTVIRWRSQRNEANKKNGLKNMIRLHLCKCMSKNILLSGSFYSLISFWKHTPGQKNYEKKKCIDNEQEKKWKMHVMYTECRFCILWFWAYERRKAIVSWHIVQVNSDEYRQRTIELWNYNASGSCTHNAWFSWKCVDTVQLNAMIQFFLCAQNFLTRFFHRRHARSLSLFLFLTLSLL